jgi:hypothetical protein
MAVTVPSAAAATFYTVSVNGTNSSASALTTSVAETVAVASTINVAVATNAASYTLPRQRNRSVSATITTTVTSGGQPVAGAAVAVTITSPGGKTTTLSATTASNGVASVAYSMKQQTSPTGTYGVSSRATIGNMTGSATTSFVVN